MNRAAASRIREGSRERAGAAVAWRRGRQAAGEASPYSAGGRDGLPVSRERGALCRPGRRWRSDRHPPRNDRRAEAAARTAARANVAWSRRRAAEIARACSDAGHNRLLPRSSQRDPRGNMHKRFDDASRGDLVLNRPTPVRRLKAARARFPFRLPARNYGQDADQHPVAEVRPCAGRC